ncbi:choice-of-anchor L domain-containing protein [Flavobacterium paronense]|uniref:Choice-of-anchor L domain-containing protein n=1 Tax=Flavobacterium paronense TaxID=1392775 RepID=A0ABV5GAV3_9FLAO|nr:choice-of-anchor L domain-containing protein [Flavobacterium paronense]MDN3676743.1 choice-of-anchor L domain-containing protein [Flavobacterium paronense]
MKKKLLLLFLFFQLAVFSQSITVNTTQYTVPQLVQNILFGNSSSSCLSGEVSNITSSTGTNFGSSNGIGFFSNTNPNFPINSGVILSTGAATNSNGPNTSALSDGVWPGDADLLNYIQSLGIDTWLTTYNDATVLEFDFQPYVNQFSFDFLFASEEYGDFQCAFSDAFAFFLTDLTAGTPTTNIALVPNTTIPISVVTIRNSNNNPSCSSQNQNYFGNYNGGTNANTSATNFNGETVVMTAQSVVNPLHTYHIKLVISDRNDHLYDSAVFLAGGTFEIGIGQLQGAGVYEGLTNIIQTCPNEEITIQAGATTIPNVTYSWTKDGVPLPAISSSTLTVTQSGVYQLVLNSANGCQISSSSMSIQYFDPFPINEPINLYNTANIFDLTTNMPIILDTLNPADYTITYHNNLQDAQNLFNSIQNPINYTGQDGEIVYVAIESVIEGCIETKSFILNAPATPPNDKCSDAVELIVGTNFNDNPETVTNLAATNNDFNLPCFCDGNYTARDIWYTLVVPNSGNVTIETQGNGGLNDTVLEAFSSCSSNVSIGCNNNNNPDSSKLTVSNLYSKLNLTGLPPGQSIVLRAFGKNESQGSFTISAYDSSLSNEDFTHSKLSYYPVPVIDYLTISNNYNIQSVEVYNLFGEKIMSKTYSSTEISIDMSALQSSVYLIKTLGDNNRTETFKIVKN